MGSRQNQMMQSMLLYVDRGQDPCLTKPDPPPPWWMLGKKYLQLLD